MDTKQIQKISKALADPRRYEIFTRIAGQKELACSDVRCDMPISPATLSHHLKELSNAGLIDIRKEARFAHMKVRRKVWRDYLSALNKL
jgi:ArsR family transcriptional regulator